MTVQEDFEKWLKGNDDISRFEYNVFDRVSFKMQYGVWLAYFDSVRIVISMENYFKKNKRIFEYGITFNDVWEETTSYFKSRQEAQKEALQKAKEIRQKQLDDE